MNHNVKSLGKAQKTFYITLLFLLIRSTLYLNTNSNKTRSCDVPAQSYFRLFRSSCEDLVVLVWELTCTENSTRDRKSRKIQINDIFWVCIEQLLGDETLLISIFGFDLTWKWPNVRRTNPPDSHQHTRAESWELPCRQKQKDEVADVRHVGHDQHHDDWSEGSSDWCCSHNEM